MARLSGEKLKVRAGSPVDRDGIFVEDFGLLASAVP